MFVSFTPGAMPVLPVRDATTRITTRCNGTDAVVWRREARGEVGFYMPHTGTAGLEDRWIPLLGVADRQFE